MVAFFHSSARLVLRRSLQTIKRHKVTTTDKSVEKTSQSRLNAGKKEITKPQHTSSQPLWERLGPVSEALGAYGRMQKQRPWATQVGTSLVIYFCGDQVAQKFDGEEYDPWRTMRHLTIGAVCSIPAYSWFATRPLSIRRLKLTAFRFMYLNRCFNYSSKLLSLATKVVVNQIVFAPIFSSYFFGMQSLLSGDNIHGIWERLKRTVPTSILNSFKLWPAVTAFNFTYIQPQYRALFAGQ